MKPSAAGTTAMLPLTMVWTQAASFLANGQTAKQMPQLVPASPFQ
jgi:hypothetical protein